MARGIYDERYRALIRLLRKHRETLGVTQAALAERLNRPQQFVSKYESGERRLDVIEFLDITRAMEIDWRDTLQSVDKPKR